MLLKNLTLKFELDELCKKIYVTLKDPKGELVVGYHLDKSDVEDERMCFIGYDAFLEPLYAEARKRFDGKYLTSAKPKKRLRKKKLRRSKK